MTDNTQYYQHCSRKWDTTCHNWGRSSHLIKLNHGWFEITKEQYNRIRKRNCLENQKSGL